MIQSFLCYNRTPNGIEMMVYIMVMSPYSVIIFNDLLNSLEDYYFAAIIIIIIVNIAATDYQSYQTDSGVSLFNRTFNRNQYFYCKSCKTLWLVENGVNATGPCYLLKVNDTNSVCSYLELSKSVIYPGNLVESSSVSSKRLCMMYYKHTKQLYSTQCENAVTSEPGSAIIKTFCFTFHSVLYFIESPPHNNFQPENCIQ